MRYLDKLKRIQAACQPPMPPSPHVSEKIFAMHKNQTEQQNKVIVSLYAAYFPPTTYMTYIMNYQVLFNVLSFQKPLLRFWLSDTFMEDLWSLTSTKVQTLSSQGSVISTPLSMKFLNFQTPSLRFWIFRHRLQSGRNRRRQRKRYVQLRRCLWTPTAVICESTTSLHGRWFSRRTTCEKM